MAKYQNILVAVDGSDEAKQALIKALEMTVENDAHLIITHVIDTRTFVTIEQFGRSFISKVEKYGQELLDSYKELAKEFDVENVTTALEFGSPRGRIPHELATKYEADLMVAGATGLNAVERVFIGSVSEAISRHAPCDVLIVRKR